MVDGVERRAEIEQDEAPFFVALIDVDPSYCRQLLLASQLNDMRDRPFDVLVAAGAFSAFSLNRTATTLSMVFEIKLDIGLYEFKPYGSSNGFL